jgi:hypothetical protein
MTDQNKQLFLTALKDRFQKHMHRHQTITWSEVENRLLGYQKTLDTIYAMEQSGGEPDVFVYHDQWLYVDFSKESPKDRTNTCYDEKARVSRKKFPPPSSAIEMAEKMGIHVLDETLYQAMQEVDELDLKTSSWLSTPDELRKLGGALFGDRRYNRTFIYHNGADSYYGVRGFRGYVTLEK